MTNEQFFGRQAELELLRDCLGRVRDGRTEVALVGGDSGIGKSALLQSFLDRTAAASVDSDGRVQLVLLKARCYKQETAPLRAVGAVVNDLAEILKAHPEVGLKNLDLGPAFALATLFPVFRKVPDAPEERREDPLARLEPIEVRERAISALRQLLNGLRTLGTVILYVDNLQWADEDSLELLRHVLEPPAAPPLLLMASFRQEASDATAKVQTFLDRLISRPFCTTIELGPLPEPDVRLLTEALFTRAVSPDRTLWSTYTDVVAREAEGNPLLAGELVRYIQGRCFVTEGEGRIRPTAESPDTIRLDNVLTRRVEELPPRIRAILELIAVAGDPVAQAVIIDAAGLTAAHHSWEQWVTRLRVESLVRRHGHTPEDKINTVHERVRESIVATMPAETLRAYHLKLAEAMLRHDADQAHFLARHFAAAGEEEIAKDHLLKVAEAASRRWAFAQAARLFRKALVLERDPERRIDLWHRLGDSLAAVGHLKEAAEAYLEAAAGSEGDDRSDLRRAAAEQLLRGGHISQGIHAMRQWLDEAGLTVPRTPNRAVISLLLRRARLWLRGLRPKERPESQISDRERALLDALYTAAASFSIVDTIFGAELQSRYLLLALQSGDLKHAGMALMAEAGHLTYMGRIDRARELARRAEEILAQFDDAAVIGRMHLAQGLVEYFSGNWQTAIQLMSRAEEIFTRECYGMYWETATARHWTCFSLIQRGDLPELLRRHDAHVAEAVRLGNHYDVASMKTRLKFVWLVRDDLERAREDVRHVLDTYPTGSYQVQHYWHLIGRCDLALYLGEGETVLHLLAEEVPRLRRAQLHRVQIIRAELGSLEGRAALSAAARQPGETKRHLSLARKAAARLRSERLPFCVAWGALLEAGIVRLQHPGEPARAVTALDRAIGLLDEADCILLARVARYQKAALLGDDEQALRTEAEEWLREKGVQNIQRFVAMMAPGFPGEET